jgi:hypothetical protein
MIKRSPFAPPALAREAVVLQPDDGVDFAVIPDDVARRSETPREMGVMHGSSERIRARPFRTEVVSLTIIVPPMMWVSRTLLGLRIVVP